MDFLFKGRFFMKHYANNPYIQTEEEWLFQDTNMVDRSPPSIAPIPRNDHVHDFEQGPSLERPRCFESSRETSLLDEDDLMVEIKDSRFYKWSLLKELLFFLCCIITGGMTMIICWIWPQLYTKLRFVEAKQTDEDAERVLVESMDGHLTLVHIMWIYKRESKMTWILSSKARFFDETIINRPRMFEWRQERFWFNHKNGDWSRKVFNTNVIYDELHSIASNCALKEIGYEPQENMKPDSRERRSLLYGTNQLIVQVPYLWHLLIMEIFKPFFLFQVFSIVFWICSEYEIYAYVILVLTIIAVLYNIFETRQNLLAVKKLATSECEVKRLTLVEDESTKLVLRPILVSSSKLLPGDIIQIEAGMIFPCDLVLLVGQCIVNESMLTGESAPVPKTPLPLSYSSFGQVFQTRSERDGRYKLLSGTKALQIRSSSNPHVSLSSFELESLPQPTSIWQFVAQQSIDLNHLAKKDPTPVAGMVISTAYGTAKGQLVRAILYPKPSKYDFEKKLYYFLANLGLYLVFVCAITIIWQAGKETNVDILKNCINLITIAVPPALPLALSIGLSVSFTRLQGRAIYCINPNRIINAGCINTLCFDKTGTLTEDGLSLKGVLPIICDQSNTNFELIKCGDLEEDLSALYLRSNIVSQYMNGVVSYDKTAMSSLGLFFTLAAAHNISLLDQPTSYLSRGNDLTDIDGHRQQGWKARLCTNWKSSRPKIWYNIEQRRHHPRFSTQHGELHPQAKNHFIGDPLEIQIFLKTGWRYLNRPEYQDSESTEDFMDPPIKWENMHPSIDTIIIPPNDLGSHQILVVMRRFDFDSEIRLMSSIILELPFAKATFEEARIWLLVKGAPESLQEVCDTTSLPQDFSAKLQELTLSGYRVLACGFRLLGSISLQQIMVADRNKMEIGIIFSGFVIMENKIKSETPCVLQELAKAGLHELMVTGDNPLTAISVARKCGPFFLRTSCRTFLIDRSIGYNFEPLKSGCVLKDIDSELEIDVDAIFPTRVEVGDMVTTFGGGSILGSLGAINLVITGRAFSALSLQQEQLIEKFMEETNTINVKISDCITPLHMILAQTSIFSRMSPQNKFDLMRSLQNLGYVVCMIGDGANDSNALKAADVGISIASKPMDNFGTMEAGPSIAAPFNTKISHIGVVPMVLAEGRCALVNATIMFKYMYFYALIQATAVMVLYRLQLELSPYQYLWADLGLVFPMVLFMPTTKPRKQLSRGRPESNLLAFPILLSVYGQGIFIILFQAIAQVYLHQQTWYETPNVSTHSKENMTNSEYTLYRNQNSTISFLFSSFQYVSMAMALSQSFGMFRCSPLSNFPLISTIISLYILCSIFILKPMPFSLKAFSMVDLSEHMKFLYGLWVMAIGNSLLFLVFERYMIKHKSTDMDMRTIYDEEMKIAHVLPPYSSLHKIMVALKGEEEIYNTLKPVIPDYFKVAKIAAPIWARLISS